MPPEAFFGGCAVFSVCQVLELVLLCMFEGYQSFLKSRVTFFFILPWAWPQGRELRIWWQLLVPWPRPLRSSCPWLLGSLWLGSSPLYIAPQLGSRSGPQSCCSDTLGFSLETPVASALTWTSSASTGAGTGAAAEAGGWKLCSGPPVPPGSTPCPTLEPTSNCKEPQREVVCRVGLLKLLDWQERALSLSFG